MTFIDKIFREVLEEETLSEGYRLLGYEEETIVIEGAVKAEYTHIQMGEFAVNNRNDDNWARYMKRADDRMKFLKENHLYR